MTSTTTTTTVTETYDKVITYEPPPVKLTTVYAPHAVRTFYNSYRVPRLHTVYKSVSPPRIHTVISTPRLHTIVTEPARVETSIIKVTPPAKKVTTTTTSTVNIPIVTTKTVVNTPAVSTVWPPVRNVFNYYHHPRFSRAYNDVVTTETVHLPIRSRSVHSLVKDDQYEYEYTETTNADNKTTFEYKVKSAAAPEPAPAPAPEPAAEPAPEAKAEEPAPAAAEPAATIEEAVHYLRPSKSFNGLNTLTYNSFVYDLNHGFDSNHKHVTVLKESVNESGCTVSGKPLIINNTSYELQSLPLLPASSSSSLAAGVSFDGNSFGLLTERLSINGSFNVSFSFRTQASNGIVLLIVDPQTSDSFFVELYDSQLRATLLLNGEPDSCWTDFSIPFLSNHIWIDVEIHILNNKMTMKVKNNYFTKTHRCPFKYPIRGDLYVAGHPAAVPLPYALRSKNFFLGEIRNAIVNNDGVTWYGHPTLFPFRHWY